MAWIVMWRGRAGFTLIELLIVVVIVGILAAIGIGKYRAVKDKAFIASMKADLHVLLTVQESYYAENMTYFGGTVPSADIPFSPSSGVTITLQDATAGGFAATATHDNTSETCALFQGTAAPVAPATLVGIPTCT